jgi:predicted metalloprotease with PDZ domain
MEGRPCAADAAATRRSPSDIILRSGMLAPMYRALLLGMVVTAASAAESARFSWAVPPAATAGITLLVDLDALPEHGLVYSREWISEPGLETLVYPLWIPGTHAPSGPVENIGGLVVCDDAGNPVPWERDPRDPWSIHLHPAQPLARVRLDITYIANQSTDNSEGIDIASSASYGLVNWNCLLFYPAGFPVAKLPCTVSARLPTGWDCASALEHAQPQADVLTFPTAMLTEVVDRPLLCGERMQHVVLRPDGRDPGVSLHIVAQNPHEGVFPPADLQSLKRMPLEADQLFGGSWFRHYDILMVVGSADLGLEHGSCSVDGLLQSGIDNTHDIWSHELTPHEFVHSWVGKHRRPIGMLTATYQETPVQDDLWVYEGLTELLGRVLGVRCGYITPADWRAGVVDDVLSLQQTSGRSWRSLRDICRCTYQLRTTAAVHGELRRNQDYYGEGALFWLVVDRRIRAATSGARSLDDLCRNFFGPHGATAPGYSEAELIAALNAIAPLDWAAMVHRWIDGTGDLDVAAIMDGSGWSIQKIQVDKQDEEEIDRVGPDEVHEAMGCSISGGYIREVDAGGVASGIGLCPGDFLYSINGTNLRDDEHGFVRALATASVLTPAVILVMHQNRWETLKLVPKPLAIHTMVRDAGHPDAFAPLLAPHVLSAAQPGPAPRQP